VSSPSARSPRAGPERAALLGLLANALLSGVKLTAGVLGHSFALVADAAESLIDIIGSAVIWGALRYGGRPPDEEHPFGHGKAEALAALAVACMVVVAGIGIAVEAIRQILSPHRGPAPFTLFVLIGVVIVKEALFHITRRAARTARSSAGQADAWHHRADAITSLFALVGIAVALIGGPEFALADDIAALAASGVIVLNGLRLMGEPLAELLDRHAPDVAESVRARTHEVEGVKAIERCEVRRSGRGYRVVMHVEVDPLMTVADSHRLTGIIKAGVRAALPEIDTVLVHIEPFDPARPAA
jgi:cation diffusion facilitator family transporter